MQYIKVFAYSACRTNQGDKTTSQTDNVWLFQIGGAMGKRVERLPYQGESAHDRKAFESYMEDVQRGKSLLQLIATKKATTPEIRKSWSARSFTAVQTSEGIFDDVICNISYHFHKRVNKDKTPRGSIAALTFAAQQYFRLNRHQAKLVDGLLELPDGQFEPDGRIVTYYGQP